MTTNPMNKSSWWLIILLLAVVYLFWKPLFGGEEFAFRDAAHFYPPQWKWACSEWASGRVPLWNPLLNLGEPHLADNTSSVFYPGKLIFALPFEFHRLYNIFLTAHVLLAGLAMWWLAKSWNLSSIAAAISAVSYALSGSIVFQYCNAPFLIGASWLPIAVSLSWRLLEQPDFRRCVALSIVLSLMILGGDAQSVYHVGLLMLLIAWMRWRALRTAETSARQPGEHRLLRMTGAVFATTVLVALISAVQVIPTVQRTRTSLRANADQPATLMGLIYAQMRDEPIKYDSLLGKAPLGSHDQRKYEFSIGPWRWLELVWPNVGGKMFPVNSRWMNAIPAESRVWSPSLYSGLVPFLLCWGCFANWRSRGLRHRWIVWATMLSLAASLGVYGIGWLMVEFHNALGHDTSRLPIGHAFGGLYWLMATALPCYSCFRYPAKLWTITALGLSLLAGTEWDEQRERSWGALRSRLLSVVVLTGVVWAIIVGLKAVLLAKVRENVGDSVFGPLQPLVLEKDLIFSLAQTGIVAIVSWLVIHRSSRSQPDKPRPWAGGLVLVILAMDLCTAHSWLIQTCPIQKHAATVISRSESESKSQPDQAVPQRVYRPSRGWRPQSWAATTSRSRFEQLLSWDRETLFPHYQLDSNIALMDAPVTIPDAGLSRLFRESRLRHSQPDFPTATLRAMGVTQQLTRRGDWQSLDNVAPRAWVARRVDVKQSEELSVADIWFPDGNQRDFVEQSIVEVDTDSDAPELDSGPGDGICEIVEYSPQIVRLQATMQTAGLLVCSDAYSRDWRAEIRPTDAALWQSVPVYRTNRVMRSVWLEEGAWQVRFVYRPTGFYVGTAISLLTLVCAGIALVASAKS